MPDRDVLPRSRWALRAWRVVMYLATATGGVSAMAWVAAAPSRSAGALLVIVSGVLSSTGALVALIGVASGRYRVEWVAARWASTGVAVAALLAWTYAGTGRGSAIDQAAALTALAAALSYRASELGAHAARLRTIHTQEQRWTGE